jgi:hypothetical protein
MGKNDDIDTMTIDELKKRVAKGKALIAELKALFPGLVVMTGEDRLHTEGRMKSHEPAAFAAVYDAADAKPEIFASLADKDDGVDPTKFETDLLRARLERRNLVSEIATDAERLATAFGDTVLELGARVAPVSRAAYKLGKVVAETDAQLRTLLAPAIDAYARPRKRAPASPPAAPQS